MTRFRVAVHIVPRKGVLDPQGKAIHHSVELLGHQNIDDIRQGKYFELDIDAGSAEDAKRVAAEAADKLLANPVTEDYSITVGAQ